MNKFHFQLILVSIITFIIRNPHQNLIYNHFVNQIFKVFILSYRINNFKNPVSNHINENKVINLIVNKKKIILKKKVN